MPKDSNHTIQLIDSIARVKPRDWNALIRDRCPFLNHSFLKALETCGCVGPESGWLPRHLCCFQGERLIAALPLYEKHNSWGEFVFDHAWADAYARHGLAYYPKLVCAIPFTPAAGQRLLAAAADRGAASRLMVAALRRVMAQAGCSSAHCLFPDDQDFDHLRQQGALWRQDCQFHWHNRGFKDFSDFLSTLKSRKRKKILQERRRVREAGLTIRWLDGHSAGEADWAHFTRLYRRIYDRKYGLPAFNEDFFMAVAAAMPGAMSIRVISSAMSAIAARCAILPPTPPAPIRAIFENRRASGRVLRAGATHFAPRR